MTAMKILYKKQETTPRNGDGISAYGQTDILNKEHNVTSCLHNLNKKIYHGKLIPCFIYFQ